MGQWLQHASSRKTLFWIGMSVHCCSSMIKHCMLRVWRAESLSLNFSGLRWTASLKKLYWKKHIEESYWHLGWFRWQDSKYQAWIRDCNRLRFGYLGRGMRVFGLWERWDQLEPEGRLWLLAKNLALKRARDVMSTRCYP